MGWSWPTSPTWWLWTEQLSCCGTGGCQSPSQCWKSPTYRRWSSWQRTWRCQVSLPLGGDSWGSTLPGSPRCVFLGENPGYLLVRIGSGPNPQFSRASPRCVLVLEEWESNTALKVAKWHQFPSNTPSRVHTAALLGIIFHLSMLKLLVWQ